MPSPSSLHNEQIDWYKPLDDSPSAWMMLKHLGLLLCKGLLKLTDQKIKPVSVERKGMKQKPARRFETGSKHFPLRVPPSIATYSATLASLNPYNIDSLPEEEMPALVADSKNLYEKSDFKKEQGRELSQERPVTETHSISVLPLAPPKSLDSMDDINTWILLNIDEATKDTGQDAPSVEQEMWPVLLKSPENNSPSLESTPLEQHVAQTKASIDALVNAYFSQTR
jgi:hypothetical protein